MDVFLIPVGPRAYHHYCELGDHAGEPHDHAHARGWMRGLVIRFRAMLHAAEHEDVDDDDHDTPWTERLRRRALRFVAQRVAQQRLLWALRRRDSARLQYPADLDAREADRRHRLLLAQASASHLRWLVFDALLLVASALLAVVPGPNVIAYYLAFAVVAHYLSWRGARRALRGVHWALEPSDVLVELRRLAPLDGAEGTQQLASVEARLGLKHLARFLRRVTPPAA
ncbi:MAG: hypothetical protein KJ061_08640 [Vicinamibacteraceae bacterium]|nr:hypothetical protein [Vicinamibacteraceae bacterium]